MARTARRARRRSIPSRYAKRLEGVRALLPADVGGRMHHGVMADIDIRELRAYEPFCADCGESGPIETSAFLAFAWEQAHDCATAQAELTAAS